MKGRGMEDLDYWRLCDELSIPNAALLVVGCDPSEEMRGNYYASDEYIPPGYDAVVEGITAALRREIIKGHLVLQSGRHGEIEGSICIQRSTVEVESLRQWLKSRGFCSGFFFPTATDAPDYLDPTNSRYAPKLAAAVRAWQAVTELGGKHPKQALVKWLREHATKFDLSDDDGNPNQTGIEEVAKVANWQRGGGAPKTPST